MFSTEFNLLYFWEYLLLGQFSVLLVLLIISEFGGAIWALISPVKFEDQMTKAMEDSFSSYTKHNDVAKQWKSLQEQVIFPGLYRKPTSLVV
jgi:hypothetical protein